MLSPIKEYRPSPPTPGNILVSSASRDPERQPGNATFLVPKYKGCHCTRLDWRLAHQTHGQGIRDIEPFYCRSFVACESGCLLTKSSSRIKLRTLNRPSCSPPSRISDRMLRLPATLRLCESSSLTRLRNRNRSASGAGRSNTSE